MLPNFCLRNRIFIHRPLPSGYGWSINAMVGLLGRRLRNCHFRVPDRGSGNPTPLGGMGSRGIGAQSGWMEAYKRGSHTVWDCKYHVVWVTKYRRESASSQNAKGS
jgi:hypothetical protein